MVNIVESYNLLIKFEEVNLVGHDGLYFLLVLPIDHSDACLRKIVCHC